MQQGCQCGSKNNSELKETGEAVGDADAFNYYKEVG
jgi:hypothetical protein